MPDTNQVFWQRCAVMKENIKRRFAGRDIIDKNGEESTHIPDVLAPTEKGKFKRPEGRDLCFIISREDWDKGTSAGAVVEATLEMGARRIVEGTHGLATNAQIDEELKRRADIKANINKVEMEKKTQFVINLPNAAGQAVAVDATRTS